ncbi:MAG: hypothetical protein IT424_05825 [Pirellulales bacterium]|nr:hypothetical protein [Pirellulales bacterium]
MDRRSRRRFLAEVGEGMLVGALGSAVSTDLGISSAWAGDLSERLTFGPLEPLASLMQEAAPESLLPQLATMLKEGTDLRTMVAAAALANARAFGGQDYTGYHAFMALAPAYQIAQMLPAERQPLPVFKVLYRNSSRIQQQGLEHRDAMHPASFAATSQRGAEGEQLRQAVRAVDWEGAERQFAALATGPADQAFDHLQYAVQDEVDVHRVVLSWRAWVMLGLAGDEYAHTLLRQSVRYCLDTEQQLRDKHRPTSEVRQVLPRLLDEFKLLAKAPGDRAADDAWVEELARTIFSGSHEQAASAAAAALAEGMNPTAVAEAICMAANSLVLHDPGRRPEYSSPGKPPGCVHGDSVGVHASDAANAWRNIAAISNPRNKVASLIVAAYHTAGQLALVTEAPYPYSNLLEQVEGRTADALLQEADEAIRSNDQARACAVVHRYGELDLPAQPVFDLFAKYAVSEDGALHAEKYYRTVMEEYAAARPALRWRQLVALARVTASEYGFPAPGYQQACELLRLS